MFLSALRDANDDLADVHCVRAEEQVAEGELVRIEIAGNDADGETVRRTCEVIVVWASCNSGVGCLPTARL